MTDCQLFKGNFSTIKRFQKQFNKSRKKELLSSSSTIHCNISNNINNKVVVFDLDETLGSFGDLYVIWTGICNIIPDTNETMFDSIFDLFPDFLRCNILPIIAYIHEQKTAQKCHKLFIYTNNKCSKLWATQLLSYLSKKVICEFELTSESIIFDKIILAFKINNEPVETHRTTHSKTFNDLIKCTMLPVTTEFCFVDDYKHEKMICDNVYYICPKPFNHKLTREEIIRTLVTHFTKTNTTIFKYSPLLISYEYWNGWFSLHGPINNNIHFSHQKEYDISQKILQHIKNFFNMNIINKSLSSPKLSSSSSKLSLSSPNLSLPSPKLSLSSSNLLATHNKYKKTQKNYTTNS